jgi:urea transport system ATP-binding protein
MLEVEGLHVHYGASHALRGVSLRAEPGRVTCLLGRNGVGKTTLLKAVLGHVAPSAGRVRLAGTEVQGLPAFRRARLGIASVPQGREIFPRLTVKENLETGFAALAAGPCAVADEVLDMFPALRDMLGRRGGDLSGGQQQQLAIARALVTRPKALLLDEPTEGIQPNIVKLIGEVIVRLAAGGLAILLVEQYLDFATEVGDRFVILDRGQAVLSGTKADLDLAEARRYLTV